MNRIRLLPEQVANQIAAGEVVERPASVVKELVENSLDAQAERITVEIQAGGRSLVRVTDDGLGMSRDDALLCLERHATSKIKRAEDLAAIATMGFRGEALPSIASVSRFLLTTRERNADSPEATRVVVNGGKILEVKAAGGATGTSIEVRQIFFNLPARRKFLRSEETEASHIQHYLTLAALAYPEVSFVFNKDARLIWQLPSLNFGQDMPAKLRALQGRLRAFWGEERGLLAVDFNAELGAMPENSTELDQFAEMAPEHPNFHVWGFIGLPGVSRATREDQHLFVNRRPVENRALNFALLEGYHTALMKGRYPVCCLFIELDPAGVDVNIHPAKREVKFHREFDVRRLVTQAVRQTLMKFHAGEGTKRIEGVKQSSAEPRVSSSELAPQSRPAISSNQPPGTSLPIPQRQFKMPSDFEGHGTSTRQPPVDPPQHSEPPSFEFRVSSSESAANSTGAPAFTPLPNIAAASPPSDNQALASGDRQFQPPVPLLSVPLRLVGVIGDLYVVLESDRGLVLLDQHAAHERVLFEQMLNRLEQAGQAPSQRLLLPETIELAPRDAQFLREQLVALSRLGVGLSEFGERTFLLDALPPFVKAADPRRFVLDLVDELKSTGREVNTLRLGEHMIAKTVCRHAVKAHDPLVGAELENLIEDLRRCVMPYTCPHGRPTLLEMNYRELEKKFGRQM